MTQKNKKTSKEIIDGDRFVYGGPSGNYIRIESVKGETVKISEMDDDEEIIITGKQLKQLQGFWKNETR